MEKSNIYICAFKDLDTDRLENPFFTVDLRVASRQFFLSLDSFPEKIRDRFQLVQVVELSPDYVVESNAHQVVATYQDYLTWNKKDN